VTGRREQAFDVSLTVALVALSLSFVGGLVDGWDARAVSSVLVIAHIAPLVVRRRAPVAVLAAMVATGILSVPASTPVVALGPGILVAIYTVGARRGPPVAPRAVGLAAAGMTLVVVANDMDAGTVMTNLVGFAIAWWLGDRSRRAALVAAAHKAEAAEAARRAAAEERARIARELHDVVAHAMSVIAVQAGTGRYVIDDAPDVARSALESIETTSRGALQEMRRLLSVLRAEDDSEVGVRPAPGLDELEELVAGTADSGVAVELAVEGERRPLPPGVDLCAYRVVQEALTNVRKHARAHRASVTVQYASTSVEVEVQDDGIGDLGRAPGGHGLIGMRERVELYGGELVVGAAPGGGYRVRASIPVGDGL
jgi:signal transduction histidine kinase